MQTTIYQDIHNLKTDTTLHSLIKFDRNWFWRILEHLAPTPPQESVLRAEKLWLQMPEKTQRLVQGLYDSNRSPLHLQPLVQVPHISNFTPQVLWAYKFRYDVPYEAWDKQDPLLVAFLGKPLEWLVQYQTWEPDPSWDLLELRELAVRDRKNQKVLPPQSYKMLKHTGNREFDELPQYLKYQLLQTWIMHPSIRHESNICSWQNWDLQPDPLVVENREVKLPW